MKLRTATCVFPALLLLAGLVCTPAFADSPGTDPFMGDWIGTIRIKGYTKSNITAQVIALGDGRYRAIFLPTLEERSKPLATLEGTAEEGKLTLPSSAPPTSWRAVLSGRKFRGEVSGDVEGSLSMKPLRRESPTLGKKPPRGAVVLFDGKDTDEWLKAKSDQPCGWKITDDGALEVTPRKGSIISRKKFLDHSLHVEFRTPFMPKSRGQGRGNSGVYVQGRYEVQVLDSYGLEGKHNECGGIYGIAAPDVNMCLPPGVWQTYDIDFTAPRFDDTGKMTSKARMTVRHNGVVIHNDQEVPRPTAANAGGDVKKPGGLYLQDHGNPVQYRNIWVLEK